MIFQATHKSSCKNEKDEYNVLECKHALDEENCECGDDLYCNGYSCDRTILNPSGKQCCRCKCFCHGWNKAEEECKHSTRKVNWYDEGLEEFYGHNNEGLVWGIYYYDENGSDVVEVEWYKTKMKRDVMLEHSWKLNKKKI